MMGLALNIAARGLVIVFQFVNIKLYTNYLDSHQLGIYFFLLSASYSVNALLFIPIDYYQQANLMQLRKSPAGIRPLLILNRNLMLLYVAFSVLIILGFLVIWRDQVLSIMLLILLAYALYVVQALRNTMNNLDYRNCVSISFVQEAVLKVIFFYLMANLFQANEVLLIIAWLSALVLTGVYLAWKANQNYIFSSNSEGDKISVSVVFRFSLPFSIGAACNWLQLQGYRLVLVPLGFSEAVGIFATVSAIGSAAIGAVSLIYNQQFIPLIYNSKGKYTARFLKGAILVVIGVAIIMGVLAEPMMLLLTSPMFSENWDAIFFGVFIDGAVLLIGALAIHISIAGKTKQLVLPALTGLASMALCFCILFSMANISIVTIGFPLVISQWLVVVHMFLIFMKLKVKILRCVP